LSPAGIAARGPPSWETERFIGVSCRLETDRWSPRSEVRLRPRGKLAQIPGILAFMQPVQDLTLGARLRKSKFQYTLQAGAA
jgi:hypothetical protein